MDLTPHEVARGECDDCHADGVRLYSRDAGDPAGYASCRTCFSRREKTRAARERRRDRDGVRRSCGLVKVRGTLGGTYWE